MNLLSITPTALVIVDSDQRIRLANAETEFALGISAADTGRRIYDVLAGSQSDEIKSCLWDVIKESRSREIEIEGCAGRRQLVRIRP